MTTEIPCSVCGTEMLADQAFCSKKCRKKDYDRRYYERRREEIKARVLAAYHANPEAKIKATRRYRETNLEQCRERQRVYYKQNAEKIKARVSAWRKQRPGGRKEEHRRYREKYPDACRERPTQCRRRRRAEALALEVLAIQAQLEMSHVG